MLVASPAHAWGDDAHKVVCQIATDLLTKEEQKEVEALVRAFTLPDRKRYRQLATACPFADVARGRARAYQKTKDTKLLAWAGYAAFDAWHFMNTGRDVRHIDGRDCGDCVLRAVSYHAQRLANPALPAPIRGEALVLLAHWVADVHQPLHVGYADDRGGNGIDRLTGLYGEAEDLHAVWDSGILLRAMGTRDWRAYADDLRGRIDPAKKKGWLRTGPDAVFWADESYRLATEEALGYCTWTDGRCAPMGRERTLGPEYQARYQPVVEERLQQAGVRLARMISDALRPQ